MLDPYCDGTFINTTPASSSHCTASISSDAVTLPSQALSHCKNVFVQAAHIFYFFDSCGGNSQEEKLQLCKERVIQIAGTAEEDRDASPTCGISPSIRQVLFFMYWCLPHANACRVAEVWD